MPDDNARLTAMRSAYANSGGLITGDAFCGSLRSHTHQPISLLARWIIQRRIVHFAALGSFWLPWFQFDRANLRVNTGVLHVLDELRDVFSDWELAEWFAAPNASLQRQVPADALSCNPIGVLDAARVDRFIANG